MGGIWKSHVYNNLKRCKEIQILTELLLEHYDYVIRVDTDEFLVPNKLKFESLKDYIEQLKNHYVTAEGFNVVSPSQFDRLNFNEPVLGAQRSKCYAYDALNKTAITSIPLKWSPGFHFCSAFPKFNDLYLFHMKLADIDLQLEIGNAVSQIAYDKRFKDYHESSREKLIATISTVLSKDLLDHPHCLDRQHYRDRFINGINYSGSFGGVYHGAPFEEEGLLLQIPESYSNAF